MISSQNNQPPRDKTGSVSSSNSFVYPYIRSKCIILSENILYPIYEVIYRENGSAKDEPHLVKVFRYLWTSTTIWFNFYDT